MIRIAICDDDRYQFVEIKNLAERCLADRAEQIDYILYDNSFLFMGDVERNKHIDILLLDIYMPGISGLDIASEIRKREMRTEIIFLTSSDNFAIEAFSLQASHYLLKPVDNGRLHMALERALKNLGKKESKQIVFKTVGGGLQVEAIDRIAFIESRGHTLMVHLKGRSIIAVRHTLTGLLHVLNAKSPGQFIAPGKGYIVNQKAIHIIKRDHLEVMGHIIPVAQRKYRKIQEAYFKFMFNRELSSR